MAQERPDDFDDLFGYDPGARPPITRPHPGKSGGSGRTEMRVLLIGATGTIGSEVAKALLDRHEVIAVSNKSGEYRVDLANADSIRELFRKAGRVDAVISAAGDARFAPLSKLTDADFEFSLSNKLMGQVNLVRFGLDYVNDRGSFTLTAGTLARKPMVGGAAVSLVNAGIEGFVRAAALEAPRKIRVNAVSPGWVTETLSKLGMDTAGGTPAKVVAQSYLKVLEGSATGQVIDALAK
jgi:NAD(P)-dependent dehydrogenase (short-subunit alcohol dehydrogenase family)